MISYTVTNAVQLTATFKLARNTGGAIYFHPGVLITS